MLTTLSEAECLTLWETYWNTSITGLALVTKDGKFVHANPAFCRVTEFTESELRKRRWQDITDPEDISAQEEMSAMVANGDLPSYDMTKSYITKTKRLLPVLLRVTALRTNGMFTLFVCEIAPLDRPAPAATPKVPLFTPKSFFKTLKEYWLIFIFCFIVLVGILKGISIPTPAHE